MRRQLSQDRKICHRTGGISLAHNARKAYFRSPLPTYGLIIAHSRELPLSSPSCDSESRVKVPVVCFANAANASGGNVSGRGTLVESKFRQTMKASSPFSGRS